MAAYAALMVLITRNYLLFSVFFTTVRAIIINKAVFGGIMGLTTTAKMAEAPYDHFMIITPVGSMSFPAAIVGNILDGGILPQGKSVAVDMRRVTDINEAGVKTLEILASSVQQNEGAFRLYNASVELKDQIFKYKNGLQDSFEIYDGTEYLFRLPVRTRPTVTVVLAGQSATLQ